MNNQNLFYYTGAFSLFALKHQVQDVTSVDLSKKYLAWLEQNLDKNPDLNKDNHKAIALSCEAALNQFHKEGKLFNLIISDPPSFSADRKKQSQALKNHETLLPLIDKVLSPTGRLFLFLNTHSFSLKKFENKIIEIIAGRYKVEKHLKMKEDCFTCFNF